jgi:hypothetical protein
MSKAVNKRYLRSPEYKAQTAKEKKEANENFEEAVQDWELKRKSLPSERVPKFIADKR